MGLFGKAKVVDYKDSQVCILLNGAGHKDEFYKEFSKVTFEGYELKTVHAVGSFSLLGTGGDTVFAFYFQKR